MLIQHHDRIRWLIPDHYWAFSFPGGKIYLNVKESSMMLERAWGFYEQEKIKAVQAFLKPGDTFVDVGGNKGDFALLAAKIAGTTGQVVCIEPEPTNSSWISRSIGLNGYTNIRLCTLALSDRDGESLLHLGAKSGLHTLLTGAPDREHGSLKVKTRSLDSLLQELGTKSVKILKIDVEGAELQVLQGAAETIRANRDIILLLDVHPLLGVSLPEVFEYLRSLGLAAYQMRPPFDSPETPHDGLYDLVARRP
jgi:FkbM family methyltransferase